jgi:hypothetical protein
MGVVLVPVRLAVWVSVPVLVYRVACMVTGVENRTLPLTTAAAAALEKGRPSVPV